MRDRPPSVWVASFCLAAGCSAAVTLAQSVGLPAPRLLTTMPMGGQAGTQVEVTISGEQLEDADVLAFSDRRITATRKLTAAGQPVPNQYVVTIVRDCPAGVYEARIMTRLGISSSRAFSVGALPEVTRTKPNTSLATAMELKVNSLCNAVMTLRAVDHYAFTGRKGQRVIVDCATRGIDSKLDAVVIVADAQAATCWSRRRGGVLDFSVPENGKYVIKVHELTFKGGPAYYYRLALQELPAGSPIARLPSTSEVCSFSWPPQGLPEKAKTSEVEPNNDRTRRKDLAALRPCRQLLSGRRRRRVPVRGQAGRRVVGRSGFAAIGPADRPRDPRAACCRLGRRGKADRRRGDERHSQPREALQQRLCLRRPAV